MPNDNTFESFEKELNRLVATFERNLAALKSPGYDEASLRQEFLNPFFRALGWDMENKAGLIPAHREVIPFYFRAGNQDNALRCSCDRPNSIL